MLLRCSILILLALTPMLMHAQVVEIDGHLKVNTLDTVSSGDTLVLKLPDGTFVIRRAADIINEMDLNQKIISYFVGLPEGVGGLLDLGESLENLYAAGASLETFLAEGITLQQILESEIPIAVVLSELSLTVDSLLVLFDPLSLFNFGMPLDSLYGKVFQEGFVFYLDTANAF